MAKVVEKDLKVLAEKEGGGKGRQGGGSEKVNIYGAVGFIFYQYTAGLNARSRKSVFLYCEAFLARNCELMPVFLLNVTGLPARSMI